jgi:hypothetical protein
MNGSSVATGVWQWKDAYPEGVEKVFGFGEDEPGIKTA